MLSDPSDHVVNACVIWYHALQGAGGDSFGARGCEHERQWCAGSGLERAREGLCALQAGQLYWPQAAPQVGSSFTRWLQEYLLSTCLLQSHLITTRNVKSY